MTKTVKTIPELIISSINSEITLEKRKSNIKSVKLDNTKAIVKTLRKIIPKKKMPVQEHMVAIILGHDYEPLGFIRLASGAFGKVVYEFRNVLFCIAYLRAFKFIMCHNHPDDDLRPSEEDVESTWYHVAWSTALGLDYVDDIILGPKKHFSFDDAKMI